MNFLLLHEKQKLKLNCPWLLIVDQSKLYTEYQMNKKHVWWFINCWLNIDTIWW